MICAWCDGEHVGIKCAHRPTWGRRGFLALCGAGIAGLALQMGQRLDPPNVINLSRELNSWKGAVLPIEFVWSGLVYIGPFEGYYEML